jgi:hypothetical protein
MSNLSVYPKKWNVNLLRLGMVKCCFLEALYLRALRTNPVM